MTFPMDLVEINEHRKLMSNYTLGLFVAETGGETSHRYEDTSQ